MNQDKKWYHSKGWALMPLAVFFLLYVLTFIFTGDLYQMPVSVAFMTASMVAVLYSKGGKLANRITQFCRGAANETIMLMVVIFILAGAFAGTAKAMGAVDATVNMLLYLLPEQSILASVFIAACFISMSMGTSTGTIAALAPIAVGVSSQAGLDLPMMLGIVIGGAMFGDNLSFISDTTIVATRTQGCQMQDKFKVNIRIVFPVVILVLLLYIYQGLELTGGASVSAEQVEWVKVLPYLAVLITALVGVNVMVVLALGIILSGVIGLITGGFGVWDWTAAMSRGIVVDMGELIIVSLMAGGMFELIRFNGGVDWLIGKMTRNIRSKRSAEFSIAGLISLTNLCTANNTIALIISGPIAKNISDKFDLDNRKIASLLDTFSCFVQGLIPYGAQLLIAAGLANVSPVQIVPYLYYPLLIGLAAIASIIFRYPRKYAA
ncbi:Na+/H+ antiporter NhaC family protein [Dysgonomonas termitidis]|uniref:Na+/H+ antiporter NhaC family protein n=1 Tax=Dysgonomonas termitidis TaxID=1516126 RepID=A0ABV9KPL8_9BACT